MAKNVDTGIERLVRQAEGDPFFVSHALAQYKAMCGVHDSHLMQVLACSRKALGRLALCRLPDDRDAAFGQQVQEIATFAPCRADQLVRVLREVAVFTSLREQPRHQSTSGLLIAARDRQSSEVARKAHRRKTMRPKRD